MSKQKINDLLDDNPVWSKADFERARPATEVLPQLFGKEVAEAMLKPRGRPKSANPKTALKLRIDPDVVEAYKSQGDGWQTRMNDALRDYAKAHGLL
jgi:uncharacterized protein (DUF4415 family)